METNFNKDLETGKLGETIFEQDYLIEQNIKYKDVSSDATCRYYDVDFLTKTDAYEVKTNYKDNNWIIVEEYTNCNKKLGLISEGWFYKSKATKMVFVSKDTRTIVILNFNKEFKERYNKMKDDYPEMKNFPTRYESGNVRQGMYRRIYLEDFPGMYEIYKK